MKKASEYREHAAECRHLARKVDGWHRSQLLTMADTWMSLAEERQRLLERHPELALEGDAQGVPPAAGRAP